MDSNADLDNSADSFFDDINDLPGDKDKSPSASGALKPGMIASAGGKSLEDSAKDGPDVRPKKAEFTEADIDRVLESDSLEIDHGDEHSPCCLYSLSSH